VELYFGLTPGSVPGFVCEDMQTTRRIMPGLSPAYDIKNYFAGNKEYLLYTFYLKPVSR
jgi:hypothetical protein